MRPIREWTLTHWLIALGSVVIVLLLVTVIYVLIRPSVFVPTDPGEQEQPGIGQLPGLQEGSPQFPPSAIEQVPLTQIQGLGVDDGIDEFARGGVTATPDLTSTAVQFVAQSPNNTLSYYDPESRRFFRIGADGSVQQISDRVFAEIDSVAWADNGNEAVLEFPDGSNIVFNFETEEQVTLPAHWTEFDFSPDSNNLAFKSLALDINERWLAVSDTGGGGSRRIAHLGDNEEIVDVDWAPNNQVAATYTQPSGLDQTEVFFVGFNQENFPLSKVQGLKFEATWAPDGSNLIYSSTESVNNFEPSLWVVDGNGPSMGQNRRKVGLNTWSHKCTFAGTDKMYCGVPTDLPEGAGLIPSIADTVPDEIYEIDLSTGASSRIAIPQDDLNVQTMIVSEDESQLFIQDRISGKLKRIQL